MQKSRWHVFPTARVLQEQAAIDIVAAANQAVAARGVFNLVLAGGNTPRAVYEMLRDMNLDWSAWFIYFGDERCLPPNHPERNSVMALNSWLKDSTVPHCQIFIISAEQGSTRGAAAYAQLVKGVTYDLVLLGLGEDGHTASLFPGHDWGMDADSPEVLSIHGAPKPPAERISLSARCLGNSRKVMFLVTGASKQQAVQDWRAGKLIPAAAIAPAAGVDVLVEQVCFASDQLRE